MNPCPSVRPPYRSSRMQPRPPVTNARPHFASPPPSQPPPPMLFRGVLPLNVSQNNYSHMAAQSQVISSNGMMSNHEGNSPPGFAEFHPDIQWYGHREFVDQSNLRQFTDTSRKRPHQTSENRRISVPMEPCRLGSTPPPLRDGIRSTEAIRETQSLNSEIGKIGSSRTQPGQGFHSLFLKQILPPWVDTAGMVGSNQLGLEFLSHLQGIMQDVIPGSRFRLHGTMTSSVQVKKY